MKTISKIFILLLIFSWIFSGWLGIKQAQAAITYVASSAHVANGTTATLTISKPTGTAENDIMIAVINQKANQVVSAPAGWTLIGTINNGTVNQANAFWKRAGASEGASYDFTKPTDDNLLWHGAISSFRGIITTGSPIDTGTGASTTRATTPANNTITATGIDPTQADVMVIFAAFRGDDFTTMPVSGGTNPTFSQAYAYETTTGTDGSISLNYGISDGAATGDRTVVCTGTAALNEGIMFALLPVPVTLSISVSPLTWGVGTVDEGTVQISTSGNKIGVTNDGNVAETFTLQIYDEDDRNEWTHSSLETGAGNNIYVLSGIFCATADSPEQTSFNEGDSEDVLTTAQQTATSTKFAYTGGSANAVAVAVSGQRSLWLRLDMPTAVSGTYAYEQHTVTVRISCQQS